MLVRGPETKDFDLDSLRHRRAMWVGDKTLRSFLAFLCGIMFCYPWMTFQEIHRRARLKGFKQTGNGSLIGDDEDVIAVYIDILEEIFEERGIIVSRQHKELMGQVMEILSKAGE